MNIKEKAPVIARTIVGLVFVVFGLNGFLQFLPMPPMEGAAAAFMGGLGAASYFFPLLKLTEIVAGLMLLSGRVVPLALLLLAPIVVNILAFHAFVAGGAGMSVVLTGLLAYLGWAYREAFAGVFNYKLSAEPEAVGSLVESAP